MMSRIALMAVVFVSLTFSKIQISFAQTVSYDFAVDVTSGPLAGERYLGEISVDTANLVGDGYETLPLSSIVFDFGNVVFTEADDIRDLDANSPRANFQEGDFLGSTYIVSRFGDRPAEIPLINDVAVDGFALDNSEFGYVVGPDLHWGVVDYGLLPNAGSSDGQSDGQSVPEPAFLLGFATVGCYLWRRRRFV